MKNNCFTFTYSYLKNIGVKIPDTLDSMKYETQLKDILENYKFYVSNKLHLKFFEGWTHEVKTAEKDDIILHQKGVGIALNKNQFMTLNHLEKLIIKSIQKHHKIRRV